MKAPYLPPAPALSAGFRALRPLPPARNVSPATLRARAELAHYGIVVTRAGLATRTRSAGFVAIVSGVSHPYPSAARAVAAILPR